MFYLPKARHPVNFSNFLGEDRGSALFDFLIFGIVLQVGLLTAGLQILNLQSSQLVAESIARHSLRSFVITGTNPEDTAKQLLQEYEITSVPSVQFSCSPNCDDVGAVVSIVVSIGSAKASATMVRY